MKILQLNKSVKPRKGSIHNPNFDPDEYTSPWIEYYQGEDEERPYWDRMDFKEKQTMISYKNHLLKNTEPKLIRALMIAVNDIHDKYPDIHIGHVP